MTGTVLVDVDGTLGRPLEHTLEFAAESGIDHDATYDDIREWNAPVPGTDYHIGELIAEMEQTYPERYVLDMPVVAGAREALEALQESGWTVTICTHRSADSHPQTARWLEENHIPYDAYVHDVPEKKASVRGDVLVDDYHKNIKDAVDAGMHAVLFESPYSLSDQVAGHPSVTVVDGWSEVLESLKKQKY